MKYFLDTYAIVEIIKGNKNYKQFLGNQLFTSILNLYELYFNLLKEHDEQTAKNYFFQFKNFLINFYEEDIFRASEIKKKYIKKRISYTDALGYAISLENGMKFLTGDKEFEDLDNVQFIK